MVALSIASGGAGFAVMGTGFTSQDDPAAAAIGGREKGNADTPATLSLVPWNNFKQFIISF